MAKKPKIPTRKARKAATGGNARRGARENTKQAKVVDLLRRPEGATIAQLVKATGWQPHTVRGALAGALKKVSVAPSHVSHCLTCKAAQFQGSRLSRRLMG
jgi:hypothetical protein